MGEALKKARLLWELDVDGIGGNDLRVADLNSDGQLEIVLRQSMGQLRSEPHFERFGPRGWYTEEERRLHCLTAIDLDGNRLWQVGEPYRGEHPYCSHGSKGFAVADLDGDGVAEVLSIDWDMLPDGWGRKPDC